MLIPRDELEVRASRSGGPGGQHVNVTSSRVEISWIPARSRALTADQKARLAVKLASRIDSEGRIRVTASDTRSQRQNRQLAEERLAALITRALIVPKKRIATTPSRAAKERRLMEKKLRGQRKRDRRGDE